MFSPKRQWDPSVISSSSSSAPVINNEKGNLLPSAVLGHHKDSSAGLARARVAEESISGKARWRRDLIVFAVGTVTGSTLFLCSCHVLHRVALPKCATEIDGMPTSFNFSNFVPNSSLGPRYAFVQLAHDAPGAPARHIWQVLAMARALKRFSEFPLLILTNTTHLPDGTSLARVLGKLNARLLPVHAVQAPMGARLGPHYQLAYWKLQIWLLKQFDKLVWLDTDSILVRSVDWLFERTPNWGQRDDWECNADGKQDVLSGGLLLIAPSEQTFQGLQRYAEDGPHEWWAHGDQALIHGYFRDVVNRPVRFLDAVDASYGKCIGRMPSIPYDSPGPWNVPAFVHRSSLHNECFYFDIASQKAEMNGKVVNMCNYHPLGPYWRDMFCDALKTIEAKTNDTEVFCDDYHWYTKD